MTILVTGGTGLLGSRLIPRLIDSGHECRALVRGGKELPSGAIAVEGDILDGDSLPKAVEGVSAIVHLAAVFRTPDTDLIWRVNLEGTRNLLAAAKAHAPEARFIMASTSNVYGAGLSRPGREDDAVDPEQAYPASKVVAEKELRESGLNWSILRLGFVYGEGDGHLESMPRLAAPMKLHPANRLSLIHHRDVAALVELALSGACDGRAVNAVDEAPTSIYEMCEIAGEPIEPSGEPLADPWRGIADGALSRRLGFRPSVATIHQAAREGLL